MKSLGVYIFDPKTSVLRGLLHGESGKPFEIDNASNIQSGQRCVAVSISNLKQLLNGSTKSWKVLDFH
jgi:hypothetical protein